MGATPRLHGNGIKIDRRLAIQERMFSHGPIDFSISGRLELLPFISFHLFSATFFFLKQIQMKNTNFKYTI